MSCLQTFLQVASLRRGKPILVPGEGAWGMSRGVGSMWGVEQLEMDRVPVSEETCGVRRGTDNKGGGSSCGCFPGVLGYALPWADLCLFPRFCAESWFAGRAVAQVISKMRPLWGALIQGD